MKSILGIVVAMAPEAASLFGRCGWQADGTLCRRAMMPDGGSEIAVVRAGIGLENAGAAAASLVRLGAGVLVSLGLSAGLSPGLRSGNLVVAERCLLSDGRRLQGIWNCRSETVNRVCGLLAAAGCRVRSGDLLSMPKAVLSAERKAILWRRFGARVADMESAAVACTAAEAGIGWLVCRAVCDPAHRSVPAEWVQTVGADGILRPAGITAALLGRPGLALDLPLLGLQAFRALRSLRTAWRILQRSCPPSVLHADGS